MDTDREMQRATEIGQANKEVIRLARNFCGHLDVVISGGVGLVEQMTGLPIGMRSFRCPYAKAAGFAGMNLEHIALDFHDRNCAGCKERLPVRLPNLLQLVEERERELETREERAALAAEQERARVEARVSLRRVLREGADAIKAAIFDILDRLDHSPTDADRKVLGETARTAPDRFDEAVQDHLFDLAEAGGWTRTEAALEALIEVTSDKSRLSQTALIALGRGEALRTAGPIVARWLDKSHKELVPPAMTPLIHLASPVSGVFDSPGLPGQPEALLSVYKMFPEIVRDGICVSLRQPDKRSRIEVCNAAGAIIEQYPNFGPEIAEDMIASVGRPDDHYDEGSAGDAVARTLAQAMKSFPEEIDDIIQRSNASLSSDKRRVIFRTYTELLWRGWNTTAKPVTAAEKRAFNRIVEIFTQRPNDERLGDAAAFLRSHASDYPSLLDSHASTLLGAAALISDDLDQPYSLLLDPRPDALKVLEAQTREISLSSALEVITEVIGVAAARNPHSIGKEVVQTLTGLGDKHDRLKGALVQSLGIMGRIREGLPDALPALYSAMMDRSQRVRASAATAYGELTKTATDDLPSLVHEAFLLLLLDPYVVVHSSAIHALREARLPDQFRIGAINRLALLINTYSASRENDRLLAQCVERFLALCSKASELSPKILQFIIATINRMEAPEAARVIKYPGWRIRATTGLADLLVKLLADPATHDWDLDDLAKELGQVPAEEVRRVAGAIPGAESNCSNKKAHLTDDLLDILTKAGAWSTAVEIARQATDRLGDTAWDRPRKLRAKATQVATELERATAMGQTEEILSCCTRWREVGEQIKRDDEENKDARNPLRGLRLPGSSE
jgi:hypothetical protein